MSSDSSPVNEFRVDTLDKAVAVMRKYRSIAQRVSMNEAVAKAEHDRIEVWLDKANAPLLSRLEFYEDHLKAYALMSRAEGLKSISLPDGDIKTRTQDTKFAIDKSAFVGWALEQKRDDLLRVSYAPDASAVQKAFVSAGPDAIDPASGEVIPGLSVVPEHVTVTIKPDMEAADLDYDEEEDDGL